MKKILYIIPVLVLAMVVLAQDAKAQSNGSTVSGQTGNASNAITQNITSTVVTNSLVGLGSGREGNVSVSSNVVGTLEFTFTNNVVDFFSKPVTLRIPTTEANNVDTDLLTLAKIINGKLEYYGGNYNSNGAYFTSQRKSF